VLSARTVAEVRLSDRARTRESNALAEGIAAGAIEEVRPGGGDLADAADAAVGAPRYFTGDETVIGARRKRTVSVRTTMDSAWDRMNFSWRGETTESERGVCFGAAGRAP
jgi:hypothetical protein